MVSSSDSALVADRLIYMVSACGMRLRSFIW